MPRMKSEIDTMIKVLSTPQSTEKVESKPEPEPEPKPEVKSEETEVKDEKEPEEKVEESQPEPELEPEPVSEPVEDKDKIISDLRAQLEEKEAKPPEKKEPITPLPEPELKLEDHNFIKDLDLDDLTREPEKLNELLNKIYQKSVTDARKIAEENVLKTIPEMVRTNLAVMQELQRTSDKFYAENEDLKPFKRVVGSIFEELAANSPDKTYDQIIKDVGPEARKRLGLHGKVAEKNQKVPPKLPTKGAKAGKTSEKPITEPLLEELDSMNKALRR